LFVGDALRFEGGKITESPDQFNLDTEKAKESIGKISTFDFDVMLGGHGEPLIGNASQKVKDFYATLKK
jgi:glyoxylase-like metal-dependent hydrolase (beta-lactamase superfamily II)